jgi:UPF0271 protein
VISLKELVLDTSAIIQGFNPTKNVQAYTVPEVIEEIKEELTKLKIQSFINSGNLIVKSPEKAFRQKIEVVSLEIGEKHVLSKADKSVLALTLQLQENSFDPTLISDDYSIQNLSTILGLKNRGLITKGIRKAFKWRIYCPGCKKQYKEMLKDRICIICGTSLKWKPEKK